MSDHERIKELELALAAMREKCSGQPINAGGLPADGVIYPGDPAHCRHCQIASLAEARDGFKEEADALRRNYLRETKELAEFADKAEAKLSALTAAHARLREALTEIANTTFDGGAIAIARSALAPLRGHPLIRSRIRTP